MSLNGYEVYKRVEPGRYIQYLARGKMKQVSDSVAQIIDGDAIIINNDKLLIVDRIGPSYARNYLQNGSVKVPIVNFDATTLPKIVGYLEGPFGIDLCTSKVLGFSMMDVPSQIVCMRSDFANALAVIRESDLRSTVCCAAAP